VSASLFVIEQSLVDLEELRATLVDEGDTEAVAAVDAQIKEWLTAEASKVTSYVGLIRSKQATVEAAKAEKARVDAILKAAEADVERLKANALAVMQRFDVKELKATPGGGLRRQGNGGLEPLDIPEWPKDASGNFKALREHDAGLVNFPSDFPVKALYIPDTEKIREEFKRRVTCPECKGSEFVHNPKAAQTGETVLITCPRCKGELTVPATVPGARLLPRGEHVRVI